MVAGASARLLSAITTAALFAPTREGHEFASADPGAHSQRPWGSAFHLHGVAGRCQLVLLPGASGLEILNALRVIQCIDEARSEFIKWSGASRTIGGSRWTLSADHKLRLDQAPIPEDAHFFRLEGWHVAPIVSEPVKVAMERVGCLGAKFVEAT